MSKQIIAVPDLGGADSVDVIEISVAMGDMVEIEDSLVVLESDKATMDVPSTHAGKVLRVIVTEGDTVSEGSAILELELTGEELVEHAAEIAESAGSSEMVSTVEKEVEEATPVASGAPLLVRVPDIGSDDEVDVIELSVAVGDSVEEGDSMAILESEKATIDVPAPFAGKVVELKLVVGGKAATGSELAVMIPLVGDLQPQAGSGSAVDIGSAPVVVPQVVNTAIAKTSDTSVSVGVVETPVAVVQVHAGPAVRALARELGVDLHKVRATGPRSRILKEDVQAYVKSTVARVDSKVASAVVGVGIPQVPTVDFSKFGKIEKIKMSRIQKITAANMQRSWLNVPHVTQFDDADITDLELFRKSMKTEGEQRGINVTPVPFMIKAIATALQLNPAFNRSLGVDGEHLIEKKYIHIGMAVDTPNGLVVPVIRDVDQKGIWQLAEEVLALAGKAREGKLLPADMQGGCFTISSLGAIGGKGFTPIVNTPEVGILGVSKAETKPVWDGVKFKPRQMLPLSLSYDHRVINGGDAGRFMTTVVSLLSDIRRLIM